MTIFWVDPSDGSILRATSDGGPPPADGAVAVKVPPSPAPESGKQKWDGAKWGPVPPPDVPDMDAMDVWEVLRKLGFVSDADVPSDRRVPPRRP